ncbi:aldo/keto reductase [Pectobacterium quasiaquaticum]|uniref:Aldo/keto reductase n=1 Tax=Pectobacterium quasiaquaticum TaxID=2774015 RepID=A0A9Q2EXI1_9GAMM|nr:MULTISPECIES: aldo/keto reductase [Pectobacterium]MBE5202365.1 aldo/keto reductase [Pectobacterium quasiaquaticum]MBE5208606.1 aldo/keto reductase [Pectobacterium quasiaquaticum]MBE5214172.1 aldo/keto reductase [Pectobacterium quasiaquaticum]MBE5219951.1 aldo/keto reductase [Pectobacterium quasiaquaticum]MBE5226372.1 aldo/keto reductase [Pectobacterium quasiaquaticum]
MKKIAIGTSTMQASNIALGCMRMAKKSTSEAADILNASVEVGIDFFDHADIYGSGLSEEVFAAGLQKTSIRRESLFLQSKCGIRKGFFDFSKAHIIASVEASLQRLKTDYLDALLLHRPDTLFEPDEVAAAFDALETSGKVRHFGVSNQNPLQIELLKQSVRQPLIANQLQFSIMHTGMIDAGFNVNMTTPASVNHDGAILEYSRLNTMTIQAWSPFQYGFFDGVFLDNEKFPKLNATLDRLAEQHHVTNTAIATAWILRHPAAMQVIIGTMSPERIRDIAAASTLSLSREEWYEIYRAAGNVLP